jgi:uncharacterized protein
VQLTPAQRLALAALRTYKLLLSPFFAGSCRFLPSCSDYAAEAIRRYGVVRGVWMAAARLARCHPLGGAGVDPVPAPRPRA